MKKIIFILILFTAMTTFAKDNIRKTTQGNIELTWDGKELIAATLHKGEKHVIKDEDGVRLFFEFLQDFAIRGYTKKSKMDALADKIGVDGVEKLALISSALKIAYDFPEIEEKEEKEKPSETSSGGGFYYTNVSFKPYGISGEMTEIVGGIINKSGKDYSIALFILSIYDVNKKLLSSQDFFKMDMRNGMKKAFNEIIDIKENQFSTYRIQFNFGTK